MNKTPLLRAWAHYEFDSGLSAPEADQNIRNTNIVGTMSLEIAGNGLIDLEKDSARGTSTNFR